GRDEGLHARMEDDCPRTVHAIGRTSADGAKRGAHAEPNGQRGHLAEGWSALERGLRPRNRFIWGGPGGGRRGPLRWNAGGWALIGALAPVPIGDAAEDGVPPVQFDSAERVRGGVQYVAPRDRDHDRALDHEIVHADEQRA